MRPQQVAGGHGQRRRMRQGPGGSADAIRRRARQLRQTLISTDPASISPFDAAAAALASVGRWARGVAGSEPAMRVTAGA